MITDETTETAAAEKPKYDFEAMWFEPSKKEEPRRLREILSGERSPAEVGGAFFWGETPQGVDFWSAEANADELSPAGRAAIEEILAQADAIGGAK